MNELEKGLKMEETEPTYKQVIVTYQFHLPDNRSELATVQEAPAMFRALWDIQNECRDVLKYGVRMSVDDFAQKISNICWTVDLDAIS